MGDHTTSLANLNRKQITSSTLDWFAKQVLDWSLSHGRSDFPWQFAKSPYRVWVSEIMLQQTQANTVVKHFDRFVEKFPNVEALAHATKDDVLSAWLGLGYYRRALRLREAALQILDRFGGQLPRTLRELSSLPGIGRSTAGAILSCAFNVPAPILDANVRRVLSRFHAVNGPEETRIPDSKLWALAEAHTPQNNVGTYTQAIMDFGSTHCRQSNPQCGTCPIRERCRAFQSDSVSLYPKSRNPPRMAEVTRHTLVILDSEGACLLKRLGESGTYARLWDTPDLSKSVGVEQALQQMQLPLVEASICQGENSAPYNISNKRITENVTVVRYDLQASVIGTPCGTSWYRNRNETPLGISVKTQRRIDFARNSGDKS